jgi:uncharacterized protein (DUF1778 family)
MSEKRDKRVYIRLTQDEKSRLEALAQKYGHSISELVRKKLLRPNAIFLNEEDRKERIELLAQSREITKTLNLYHEKQQEFMPFRARLRTHIKRTQ